MKLKIIHGNCMDMSMIPDNSIGGCVTSPPYFNAKDYGDKSKGNIGNAEGDESQTPYQVYMDMMRRVFEEIYRVLKPGRYFMMNAAPIVYEEERYPVPYHLLNLMEQVGFNYMDNIIWCFTPDTNIICKKGIKHIEDIQDTDEVISHTGVWRKVNHKLSKMYNGDLINLKISSEKKELSCSPNHKILTLKTKLCPYRKKSKLVCRSDCTLIKTHKTCPQLFKHYKLEWIESKNLKINDYVAYPIIKENNIYNKIDNVPINKETMRLFGYYLAEGSHSRNRVQFYFHKNEIEYQNDLKWILANNFGINMNEYIRDNDNVWHGVTNATNITNFLIKHFGDISFRKKLPNFVLETQNNLLKELIIAYWRGDGSYIKSCKTFNFSSNSYQLLHQIKMILLKLGILSSLTSNIDKRNRKIKTRKESFILNIHNSQKFADLVGVNEYKMSNYRPKNFFFEDYIMQKVDNVNTNHYSGQLFNLEVDKDNSYTTTNGLVHNCKPEGITSSKRFGIVMQQPYPLYYKPNNIYEPCFLMRKGKSEYPKNQEPLDINILKKFQNDVWRIQPDTTSKHPAPFPYKLAWNFVYALVPRNESVLDTFLGSGTTALAARDIDVDCVGFELESKYVEMIKERVASNQGLGKFVEGAKDFKLEVIRNEKAFLQPKKELGNPRKKQVLIYPMKVYACIKCAVEMEIHNQLYYDYEDSKWKEFKDKCVVCGEDTKEVL